MSAADKMITFGESFFKVQRKTGIRNVSGIYGCAEKRYKDHYEKCIPNPQVAKETWDMEFMAEVNSWRRYLMRDIQRAHKDPDYKSVMITAKMNDWHKTAMEMAGKDDLKTFFGLAA